MLVNDFHVRLYLTSHEVFYYNAFLFAQRQRIFLWSNAFPLTKVYLFAKEFLFDQRLSLWPKALLSKAFSFNKEFSLVKNFSFSEEFLLWSLWPENMFYQRIIYFPTINNITYLYSTCRSGRVCGPPVSVCACDSRLHGSVFVRKIVNTCPPTGHAH